MKRYVLGDYEIDCKEIHLLKSVIKDYINKNDKLISLMNEKLAQYYQKENEQLLLMLEQLERYGK